MCCLFEIQSLKPTHKFEIFFYFLLQTWNLKLKIGNHMFIVSLLIINISVVRFFFYAVSKKLYAV